MGCSTLYHLSKAGITDAILIERNQLTSGTTWHSAAQVRALRSSRNLTDLIRYSIELYSSLEQETGQATGWINKGSLSIATSEDRLEHIRRQESLARLFDVRAESISVGEAEQRWPLMNVDDVIGAVWSPDDGRVSPSDLCSALIKGAQAGGGRVFENTSVKAVFTHNDNVTGLDTEHGSIRCDAIALCTGLWSREAGVMAGVDVPVYPCEHFYLLTNAVEGIQGNMPTLSDHDSHLYIRDDSGGLLVGCFEPMGKPISPERIGKDAAFQLLPEDWDHFEPIMNSALHRLPCLHDAEVRMLLNGAESFTPDGSFLLGEAAETQGLFLGCGMNSVGVATGGGAGMALAHCIMHGHTPIDLSEADPKRFPDCFNSSAKLAERVPQVLGEHYAIHYPGYQWTTARNLRLGSLHNRWKQHHAHFGQFYGWERPLYYDKKSEPVLTMGRPDWFENVGREVGYAHEHCAVFDLSTFGKIDVMGKHAERFLNRLCANDMTCPPGRARYTAMLNERGCFESDLTVLRLTQEHFRMYVGTAAIKRDLAWLRKHQRATDEIEIHDVTEDYAVLGLMGPESITVAEQIGASELTSLVRYEHCETTIAGVNVVGANISYVGESGWELSCRTEDAIDLFDALHEAGAKPAGLFAQSSMRIEKRYLAYGHDIDTDIDPLQAGLSFAIDWESDFIGKKALMERRYSIPQTRVLSILCDAQSAVPLGNEPVYLGDNIIGKTTSAAYGYRVARPVALALINTSDLAEIDDQSVEIDIAQQRFTGKLRDGALW